MTDNKTFFDVLKRRHNLRFFKQDLIPNKDDINDIFKKSLEVCPIKNDLWHFYIDVYGPEFKKQKEELVIRTACDNYTRNTSFENQTKKYKEWTDNPESFITRSGEKFNEQVRAPYLLVFRKSPCFYAKKNNKKEYYGDIAAIGAGMFGYVVSIIANEKGIDASFCACYTNKNTSEKLNLPRNEILGDFNNYFMLGLGFEDTLLNEKIDGAYRIYRKHLKPTLDDVIKWNQN